MEFSEGKIKEIQGEPESNVWLLKLHGSMNWLVLADEWPRSPRLLLRLRTSSFSGPGHTCMVEKETGTVLRPLFVPPRLAKDYDTFGLTGLWEEAERALENATSLTVIGYRFPQTDRGARELLNRAHHLKGSDRVTYVTRNDLEAVEVFREHFPKAIVHSEGFADYVTRLSNS